MAIKLRIRKKANNVWVHVKVESTLEIIISKFHAIWKGTIMEVTENTANDLLRYEVSEIAVHDDTNGGAQEVFGTPLALSQRLKILGYTAFYTDADLVIADLISGDASNAIVLGSDGKLYATTGVAANGLPTGGTTGQKLVKQSDTNFDAIWVDDGGAIIYETITKSQLDTHITNSTLVKGRMYKVTGVDTPLYGGTDIIVEAIENNKISSDGTGIFYNPKYDQEVSGFNVWDEDNTYSVDDLAHWGGRTWINLTGAVGTADDIFNLDGTNWEVLPFNSTDYNLAYDLIKYDYENDLIVYRNEKNTNIISTSKLSNDVLNDDLGLGNPIKVFMWGNTFDLDNYVGIGNHNITDSYNENINFRGRLQLNFFFQNGSAQYNSYFGDGCAQDSVFLNNKSYQYNLNLLNNSYQSFLKLDNFSSQYNITLNSTQQSAISLNNSSSQHDLVLSGSSYQNFLTFDNFSRQFNLTASSEQYQTRTSFDNYEFDRTSSPIVGNEIGLKFQGDLPTTTTVDAIYVKKDNQFMEISSTDLATVLGSKVEYFQFAVSDESTDLTTGTSKITFRMPYAMTLTSVRASVNTAPTGSAIIINIKESGTTIFSAKPTIDVSTKTTVGSASPIVISDSSLADNAEMTVDIDQVGSTIKGKGLKVTLIGTRT